MRSSPLTGTAASGRVRADSRRWAILLWLYTVSCHACRHATGGRINHFSADPIRNRFWTMVTKINPYYGNFAWASLTARYDWSRAGTIHDPRFF
jgi:hypothetical protein